MQLTTTQLASWSTLSYTITNNINYKYTISERANLTPIWGKPISKTLHNIRNKIKANAKSVYSNIGGGEHGHLGLVLTDSQYALISTTTLFYPTHPGPLIIPYGTTAHTNSNTQIVHTEEVRLFREVTGVEQALVQQIFGTDKEAYLEDIHNRTMNSINDTVVGILKNSQDNYGQLIPHDILEREDIVKKTIYNPRDSITTLFYAVGEILKLDDITGTSYTQLHSVNTAYIIIHRAGKFGLAICKWNCITELQNTWVRFKQFFCTSHQDLRETYDLTVEESGMHHANMVRDVVTGIQEALQQDHVQTKTPTVVQASADHMANTVQNTQKQLAPQLQQIQAMM